MYPVPALLMLSVENDAAPALMVAVVVPAKVPPEGLVPIATVMLPEIPETRFPKASWTATWTPGMISAPAGV